MEEEGEEGRICARTSTAGLVSFCPANLSLSLSLGKMKQGKESDDETKKRGK